MKEPYRILLADDETIIRMATCELLRKKGWICEGVADGLEAIERLKEEEFDVVLADYKMPGNDELQLLHRINRDFPTVPLIIITGFPTMDSAVTSLKQKAFDYLTKPLDMEYLLKRIQEAAELHRRRERTGRGAKGSPPALREENQGG